MFNRDVVVHTNHNIFPRPNTVLEATPPVSEPFDLSNDLWIGRIEPDAARIVLDLLSGASERGYGRRRIGPRRNAGIRECESGPPI